MQKKYKALLGGLSVSAVAAGVALTGGTSAYYYDLETSPNNSFSACTLDLQQSNTAVDMTGASDQADSDVTNTPDANGIGPDNQSVTLTNLQPGDVVVITTDLTNAGQDACSGELWADINFPIHDYENGILDAEAADGDTTDGNFDSPDVSAGHVGGELDDEMLADFSDTLGNSFTGTYHDLAYRAPDMLDASFPAGTDTITLKLTVPDSGDAGNMNRIMGDSFTFVVDFALAQEGTLSNAGGGLDLENAPAGPSTP